MSDGPSVSCRVGESRLRRSKETCDELAARVPRDCHRAMLEAALALNGKLKGTRLCPKICAMGKIWAQLERKIPLFPAQIRSPRKCKANGFNGAWGMALSSIPIDRSINPIDSNTFGGCNTSKTTYVNPDLDAVGRGTCDFPQPTRHRTARAFQAAFADGVNVAAFSLTTSCTLRGRCLVRLSKSSDMRS